MSIEMDQAADAILQAARESASLDELSDVDVDGDGSSSLSDIEDKDSQPDDDGELSDDHSNESEEENDSEAETERLEESPNKIRSHQDVVLSSRNDNQIYDRSPSKLHNQIILNDLNDEEDDDPLSDEDISIMESPKSSVHDGPDADSHDPATAATSLDDSVEASKRTLSSTDTDSRKRKRSIMAGSGLDDDMEEPLRKRTGSVLTPGDDYAIEGEEQPEEDLDTSNPISGNISGDDGGEDEEVAEEIEEPIVVEPEEEAPETVEVPISPKKRGRKKKKEVENGVTNQDEDAENVVDGEVALNGEDEVRNGEEETLENEADDEAEAALKNEEERTFLRWSNPWNVAMLITIIVEKKRIAAEQLSAIERQFQMFKDR